MTTAIIVLVIILGLIVAAKQNLKLRERDDNPFNDRAEAKAKHLAQLRQYIKGKDEITRDEIAGEIGVSRATAARYADSLEDEGLVRQTGQSVNTRYQVQKSVSTD